MFFCLWLDADQIIGSKPSIGQRCRLLHFSSRLMQADRRRKRRRWRRILHTDPSLITVRAPHTVPSCLDNEFVHWMIHAEEKRCGRSPFYLAALMDERRADLVWVTFGQQTPPFKVNHFFLSFFFSGSSFRNPQHRWSASVFCPSFLSWCLLWLFWLKTSQIVSGLQKFLF